MCRARRAGKKTWTKVRGKLEGLIQRPNINEIDCGMATETQAGADMRMMRMCSLRAGARMSEK